MEWDYQGFHLAPLWQLGKSKKMSATNPNQNGTISSNIAPDIRAVDALWKMEGSCS
jgi:hypothetical protein